MQSHLRQCTVCCFHSAEQLVCTVALVPEGYCNSVYSTLLICDNSCKKKKEGKKPFVFIEQFANEEYTLLTNIASWRGRWLSTAHFLFHFFQVNFKDSTSSIIEDEFVKGNLKVRPTSVLLQLWCITQCMTTGPRLQSFKTWKNHDS